MKAGVEALSGVATRTATPAAAGKLCRGYMRAHLPGVQLSTSERNVRAPEDFRKLLARTSVGKDAIQCCGAISDMYLHK